MSILNRIYVQSSNIIHSLVAHSRRQKINIQQEKYVLIPLFGMIGDAVLFLDALRGYQELYSIEKGYRLVIGCRPQVSAFLKSIGLDKQFEIVTIDRGKMYMDAKEFPNTVKMLAQHYYELIINVRERYILEDVLLYAIPAKKKISFRNDSTPPESFLERFFFNNTYDEIVYADEDSEQYKRYAKLLHVLGNTQYKSRVSQIPQIKQEYLHKTPYCVICPSSSVRAKCWPTERFAAVADYIVDEYGLDICITGSKVDKEYSDALRKYMRNQEKVYDFSGETSMNGWIELIRNALFVVSNDSASVHIAAAVRTPSVCVAPQHDGYRFFPYQLDVVEAQDCLPYPVRCEKVNCFDCQKSNLKKAAQADSGCQQSIREAGTFKCINNISINAVCDAVRSLVKSL